VDQLKDALLNLKAWGLDGVSRDNCNFIFYCRSGVRSLSARNMARKSGFTW